MIRSRPVGGLSPWDGHMIAAVQWYSLPVFVCGWEVPGLLVYPLTHRFRNLGLLLDWGLGALRHADHVTRSEAVRWEGLAARLSEPHHVVAIEPPPSRGPASLSHGRKAEAIALVMRGSS